MSIACLPWYELPETEAAQDLLWSVLARHLLEQGFHDVPEKLTRGLSAPGLLTHPQLLFGQCCGYDLVYGFAGSVQLVGTPRYSAPGCEGANYRSFVLVRDDCEAGGLDGLRRSICVVNSFNSHSGTNSLRALVAPLARNGRFFSEVKVSGAHVNSLALLRAGEADVMAMDCVLHALLGRHRPKALTSTRVLCWSDLAPAPPFVTSATADRDVVGRLREALVGALSDEDSTNARAALLLDGVEFPSLQDYARIVDVEGLALGHGYKELHATSPAVTRMSSGP